MIQLYEKKKTKIDNCRLSNMLDSELRRRKPVKRSHKKVVGAAVVDSDLLSEIVQGKESVGKIEALLVRSVAAFVQENGEENM